jgi:DNA helicase-2/ATP-dependent DNA helicase PcrA
VSASARDTEAGFVTDVPREVFEALGERHPTEQQWAAISAPLEPSVLIAGAGSGKTAVMAARIAWLIAGGHARANEILGLTFTNKAAASLLERVRRAIAPLGLPDGEEPQIATYHAFASGLIADYGLRAGIEPGASLLTDAQVWQLCAEQYLARTYEHMEVRNLWHVRWIRELSDDCANHLVDPNDIIAHDREFLEKIKDSGDKISRRVVTAARKRMEIASVVAAYQEAKRARNMLDYGDQIRIASEIANDERVVADFGARYRFALLDEYQDTNVAQATMLKRLMPDGYPVMAVGDPDQNIYAWRGASLHNLLAFARQFPRADGSPANVLPLEVNFRSGARILQLANTLIEGIHASRRPPGKVLRPFPKLGAGEVAVALHSDEAAEAIAIADEAARAHDAGTPWGETAVLCRKKRLFGALVEAFRAREIPLEVIGLGGLLKMPEVVDLVALLRVIDDPTRNVALARLLRGPRWRIGHRDLAMLGRHALERNRGLREQLETESAGDVAFSLAEALDALDEVQGVSDEARRRIARFNAELSDLRAAQHLPLPEFVARALDALGIVRELDASPSPAAPAAKRNLANFLDRVAAFSPLDGNATLGSFVEWLDAVDEAEEDIEAAQPSEADSVKLMTIHQAKGLEFDLVFVPGLARGQYSQIFPDLSRRANPVTRAANMPVELRGDREVYPRFTGNLTQFTDEMRARAEEEERRLLYVAITRARRRLVCSAAHWYYPSGMDEALETPLGPSEFWGEIRAFPDVEVLNEMRDTPQPNPLIARRAERARVWPQAARRAPDPSYPDGFAATVARARANTPEDHSLFPVSEEPAPAGPRALNVTSVVTYSDCPKKFYWTTIRPLPRRSSAAARIGTIVHAWIDQEGRVQGTLVDPDDYDRGRPETDRTRIAELKTAFKASRFAGRAAVKSEEAFALVIGELIIHGRIDAIFAREGGGWEIVDWKTGRAPETEGAERWQLELYALAAQEIWGKRPDELSLTFVYLGDASEKQVAVRPASEIRADLELMLKSVAAGAFDPRPSAACKFCDFLRDCPEGRAATD